MNSYQHKVVVISNKATAEECNRLEYLLDSGYEIVMSTGCPGTSANHLTLMSTVQYVLRRPKA